MAKLIFKTILGIIVLLLWLNAAVKSFEVQECISAGAKPPHCSE